MREVEEADTDRYDLVARLDILRDESCRVDLFAVPGSDTARWFGSLRDRLPTSSPNCVRTVRAFAGVGDALVFPTATGAPQWRKNVLRALYVAGDAAKLNPPGVKRVSCHDLRHSCADLLLAAGVPAPRAAAIFRHANTRTLLTVYAGLVESQRADLLGDLEQAFR